MGIKASALHQVALKAGWMYLLVGRGGKIFPLSPLKPFHAQKLDIFPKVDCIAFTIPAKILRSEVVSGLA